MGSAAAATRTRPDPSRAMPDNRQLEDGAAVTALSQDELAELSKSQREEYRRATRAIEDRSIGLRSVSGDNSSGRTYAESWKEEFGEAVGFLFFLGSVVLFPAAIGIASAVFGTQTDSGMGPTIGIYIGLLIALSALKATFSAEQPPPPRSREQLHAERLEQQHAHWRAVVRQQRRHGQQREHRRSVERRRGRGLPSPSPSRGASTPSTRAAPQRLQPDPTPASRRGSATSHDDGARPVDGRSDSSISADNRSKSGAEFDQWISTDEKLRIADQHGWVCQLCLKPIDRSLSFDYKNPDPGRLVIDHIRPRKHGGSDDPSNLQPAHHSCNMRKGGKWIANDEFRKWDEIRAAERARTRSTSRSPDRSGSRNKTKRTPPDSPPPRASSEPSPSVPPPSKRRSREALTGQGQTGPRRQHGPAGSRERQSIEQRERSDVFWAMPRDGLLTHCQRGHEFTEENTYYRLRPDQTREVERECRQCRQGNRMPTGHSVSAGKRSELDNATANSKRAPTSNTNSKRAPTSDTTATDKRVRSSKTVAAARGTQSSAKSLPYQWRSMQMPRHMQAGIFGGLRDVFGWTGRRDDRERRLKWASDVLGRKITSFMEVDERGAGRLLQELRRLGHQ